MLSSIRVTASWLACALLVAPAWAEDDSDSKRIEDVVVYGDRVESTVSDTSISITAMSEEFLMDMGIQGPDEMVNFIPATTRTHQILVLPQLRVGYTTFSASRYCVVRRGPYMAETLSAAL